MLWSFKNHFVWYIEHVLLENVLINVKQFYSWIFSFNYLTLFAWFDF